MFPWKGSGHWIRQGTHIRMEEIQLDGNSDWRNSTVKLTADAEGIAGDSRGEHRKEEKLSMMSMTIRKIDGLALGMEFTACCMEDDSMIWGLLRCRIDQWTTVRCDILAVAALDVGRASIWDESECRICLCSCSLWQPVDSCLYDCNCGLAFNTTPIKFTTSRSP
jgi:hypothetical protein